MLKLTRPGKPEGFDTRSKRNFKKVKKQIDEGKKPSFNSSFWGTYKNKFFESQNRKCAYCECFITNYGDVEHFRPKSVVQEIKNEGQERENLNNVVERRFKNACERGYWWLAYDWNNYLLSCSLCNQPWKRALFPVENGRPLKNQAGSEYLYLSPKKEDDETALLLNPFDKDFKPDEHLTYTQTGAVMPKDNSIVGFETIRTYGLHRPQLTQIRAVSSTKTYKFIVRFAKAEEGSKSEAESAQDILDMGDEKDPNAGMVRMIFESLIEDYSWEDLKLFVQQKTDEGLLP